MQLTAVLETVLYHASGEEDELARFYAEVLGLPRIGGGLTFRVGDGVLLLFNRERSSVQSTITIRAASRATRPTRCSRSIYRRRSNDS